MSETSISNLDNDHDDKKDGGEEEEEEEEDYEEEEEEEDESDDDSDDDGILRVGFDLGDEEDSDYYDEKEDREDQARFAEYRKNPIKWEQEKEDKLRAAAYDNLAEVEKQHGVGRMPLTYLNTEYRVPCGEYMQHVCWDMYSLEFGKYIELYPPYDLKIYDEDVESGEVKLERYERLEGHLYFDETVLSRFLPDTTPPEFASRDQVVKFTTEDGQHEVGFKFLGDGYIEVEVTRETIAAAIVERGCGR